MSAAADDLQYYYSQRLATSIALAVDTTARQTLDSVGPLKPGRYLIQALTLTARCWIKTSKFVAAAGPDIVDYDSVLPAAGSVAEFAGFPLDATSGVKSVIIHVKKGVNDRVQAICHSGTAMLIITRVGE